MKRERYSIGTLWEPVIGDEVVWPRGGRSIYFRHPAGNSVEPITPGVWGLPSGW